MPDRVSGQRSTKGRHRMIWPPVLLVTLGMSAAAAENPPSALAIEESSLKQLLQIRRVYVDRLTGGETAAQMRDILLSSLETTDRKSTRLNSSHLGISYAVFCLTKNK